MNKERLARIQDLLERRLDAALSVEEERELRDLLLGDPEALSYAREQLAMDYHLREIQRPERYGRTLRHRVETAIHELVDHGGSLREPVTQQIEHDRTRRRILGWFGSAAAAAALAVCALWRFDARTGGTHGYTIGERTGTVTVSDSAMRTGPASSCRAMRADGSMLILDENTWIEFVPATAGSKARIVQRAGRAYFKVVKAKSSLRVECMGMTAEVLGTRFIVHAGERPRIQVLEGAVSVRIDEAGTVIREGYEAVGERFPKQWIKVSAIAPAEMSSAWHGAAGAPSIPTAIQPVHERRGAWLDATRYAVHGGMATVTEDGGEILVRQDGGAELSSVLLGTPRWKRATVSCQVRLLERKGPNTSLQFLLFGGTGGHTQSYGIQQILRDIEADGYNGWINLSLDFEVQPEHGVRARRLLVYPDDRRFRSREINDWQVMGRATFPTGCGIGFAVKEGLAEFRRIRLMNAASAHVVEDLVALYTFQEGAGDVVRDVSGLGEPMHMLIRYPEETRWVEGGLRVTGEARRTEDGLRVTGGAAIAYQGAAEKLADAWRRKNGLTVQAWTRPEIGPSTNEEQRDFFRLTTGTGTTLTWHMFTHGHPETSNEDNRDMTPSRVTRIARRTTSYISVMTVGNDEGKTWMHFYPNRERTAIANSSVFDTLLQQLPWELCFAPREPRSDKRDVWRGDLLAVAVYGRVLTDEEIERNMAVGVPDNDTVTALRAEMNEPRGELR